MSDDRKQTVTALYLRLCSNGDGVRIAYPYEPPRANGLRPISVESWMDVRVGTELIRPNQTRETVCAVELWGVYPPMSCRPSPIVSGREWERTGLNTNGEPIHFWKWEIVNMMD